MEDKRWYFEKCLGGLYPYDGSQQALVLFGFQRSLTYPLLCHIQEKVIKNFHFWVNYAFRNCTIYFIVIIIKIISLNIANAILHLD